MINLKNIFIVFMLITSSVLADMQEDKVCKEAKDKFEQINYLIDEHNEARGAYAIFERSGMGMYFNNPRQQYDCLEQYKDKWLYLLYLNSKRYPLQNLYKTQKSNYLIPLYLGHIAKKNKNTQKALEYYKIYVTLKKKNLNKEVEKYIKNDGLTAYKSKWAKELNPSGKISRDKFKNIFFSMKNKKPFKTTYTDELNIQSHGKFFKKDAVDVSSYHVKEYYFDKEGTYNISLNTGNIRACRVIIDGMLFSEQKHFSKKHTFSKGSHKVEIEFLNRNSSYIINFDMSVYKKLYSDKELKELFAGEEFELMFANYAPSYKGSHTGGGLQLKMETKSPEVFVNTKKPTVLILQSSKKVNWEIRNSKNLKAIIIGKHSKLTDDIVTDNKNVKIYHSESNFRAKELIPQNCKCIGAGGIYLCNSSFLSVAEKIKDLLSANVIGYTYSTKESFFIPEENVEAKKLQELRDNIEKDKKVCKDTQIDKVFKY